jgi:hypothetical protein
MLPNAVSTGCCINGEKIDNYYPGRNTPLKKVLGRTLNIYIKLHFKQRKYIFYPELKIYILLDYFKKARFYFNYNYSLFIHPVPPF